MPPDISIWIALIVYWVILLKKYFITIDWLKYNIDKLGIIRTIGQLIR